MRRSGFTFLELIIGLSIIAIIGAVGIFNFRSQDVMILDAAAQQIASDIEYSQMLVIDMNVKSSYNYEGEQGNFVVFDIKDTLDTTDPNSYRAVKSVQIIESIPEPEKLILRYVPIVSDLTNEAIEEVFIEDKDFKEVKITAVDFGSSGSVTYSGIRFEGSTGTPKVGKWEVATNGTDAVFQTAGDLSDSGGTVTVEYNGKQKFVKISRLGRISIENTN